VLLKFINYMRGNLRVEIRGAAVERFLNLCVTNGVIFWDVERTAPDVLYATIRLEGLFRLRPYARKCMCRVRVMEKRGIPFQTRRYRHRYALLGGAALCLGLIWLLSGFVWTIQLEGCRQMPESELLQLLAQSGLRTGVRSAAVDAVDIKNRVLQQTDQLSFLTVNIQGSHAQVVVRERTDTKSGIDESQPCDVVSDKTGVIHRLRVRAGAAQVKVGETIMAGERIAAGTMISSQQEVWYVHASAEADVRTWHSRTLRLPAEVRRLTPTGSEKVRYALVLGNRRINLYWIESAPFAWYDMKVEKYHLRIDENFRFPITLIRETWQESTVSQAQIDPERARQVLEQRLLENQAARSPDAQVLKRDYIFEEQEGFFQGTLKTECLETTGVAAPVGEVLHDGTDH